MITVREDDARRALRMARASAAAARSTVAPAWGSAPAATTSCRPEKSVGGHLRDRLSGQDHRSLPGDQHGQRRQEQREAQQDQRGGDQRDDRGERVRPLTRTALSSVSGVDLALAV
jgi:hypothetical protein